VHIVLTYFHQIKGPGIYVSYPDAIPGDVSENLLRFFDLELDETFFEIVLLNKKQRIINLYFELKSEWARGGKEMAMISVIMKQEYDSRTIYSFILESSRKIIKTENIFKAFYKFDDDREGTDIEIDLNFEIVKKILFECLTELISRLETRLKK